MQLMLAYFFLSIKEETYVRVWEKERERVCVCVCVCVRERMDGPVIYLNGLKISLSCQLFEAKRSESSRFCWKKSYRKVKQQELRKDLTVCFDALTSSMKLLIEETNLCRASFSAFISAHHLFRNSLKAFSWRRSACVRACVCVCSSTWVRMCVC